MNRQIIKFSKYNPSGNMTILVHSKHYPDDYASIAKQLMMDNHLCCEQVGFIKPDNNEENYHLVMSGNEFCGNATMSYIHYLKENDLLHTKGLRIKVSGCSNLVECVTHDDGSYEVHMPQPHRITPITFVIANKQCEVIEIRYGSYVHYVIPVSDVTKYFKQKVEDFIQQQDWHDDYKTIGFMLFDAQQQYLQPLIYIPELQSLIWENSCASGTASIGIFNHYSKQQECKDFIVYQPGGKIAVTCKQCSNYGYKTTIKGQVLTVATGKAYIE